ncbi:MAG TPA: GC-type dockerin domain-anchored protein [Phycisphaerales bacterium]|nr:GC-type dockerin domain-anchored protein [Phycisphaerales bacterium]
MHAIKPLTRTALAVGLLAIAGAARAQSLQIAWHTIDCGGGQLAGATLAVASTAGQHDAAMLPGPSLSVAGGYWIDLSGCTADFNLDGAVDTRDFVAFLNAWNARDPRADANGDGAIDSRDVIAFLNTWTAGCG